MLKTIQKCNAYKALDTVAQKVVSKRQMITQIADAVQQARCMGLENWRKITPIMSKYQKIVEEIVT
ncbi:hypothetical protein KBJ98_02190 [Flavobacterium sp. F-328]|uniref:Uncharacterized protein n=1 Tax=Flavobacterium erciyesense TaxID=2825842 RepID=A0ABS5D0F6_9FLAO|nr:hypothetical protein [Flavobacterium erciyesense]MBQ0907506.1 hypothetical protein [Flavobacterium erciyesense]